MIRNVESVRPTVALCSGFDTTFRLLTPRSSIRYSDIAELENHALVGLLRPFARTDCSLFKSAQHCVECHDPSEHDPSI